MLTSLSRLTAAAAFIITSATYASAADQIKVMSINAVKEPLVELIAAFEKDSGHKVTLIGGGTESVTKRVADGEIVDIVIVAPRSIDRLTEQGRLSAASHKVFAKTGIGVAVRPGLIKPDISTADAVKNAVLAAKSISYSTGASGIYLVELFAKMGIADAAKAKLVQPPSGASVGALLARGEVDLGFQQASELAHMRGIQYLGTLPPEIQHVTAYGISLHSTAPSAASAQKLLELLTAPDAAAVIRKHGMEPG
jgi:molybdate transport system substrate-binding protein